jgi:hypothetical protein
MRSAPRIAFLKKPLDDSALLDALIDRLDSVEDVNGVSDRQRDVRRGLHARVLSRTANADGIVASPRFEETLENRPCQHVQRDRIDYRRDWNR